MNVQLWRSRFREYMEALNWSGRTIETYGAELSRFLAFLKAQRVDSVSDINRDVIESYRSYLFTFQWRGKRLELNSQVNRMSAVKAFLRFLVEGQYLLADPSEWVCLPQVRRKLPRDILTEAQVEQLLRGPDITDVIGVRDRAVIELLYSCALRNSELAALHIDDVDLDEGHVWVVDGKGHSMDKVTLGDEAALWVRIYLQHVRPVLVRDVDDTLLFLSWRGRALERETVANIVAKAAERAGLTGRITAHVLRHCCATHMLARGASLRHIQQHMRHRSIESTERYTHVEISDLREVHRRFHPRERSRQA